VAQSCPDVVIKVYYPKESARNAAVMRADPPGVAHGGLMSILLHLHASCKRTYSLSSFSSKTAAIRIRLIGAKVVGALVVVKGDRKVLFLYRLGGTLSTS
jgi:hypothetical protein